MHLVYRIIIDKPTPPYYYVGSKSNCSFIENVIFDAKGKQYWGSSKSKLYRTDLQKYNKSVEVLHVCETYENCIELERKYHMKNDVVANPHYYNLGVATVSTFSKPGYGTYVHSTGKVARLPIDHPAVLSGEWVSVTKGKKFPNKKPKKLIGEDNPFYGKKHTPNTISKIKRTKKDKWENDLEWREKTSARISEQTRKLFKGKPKSEEQKRKMSESNGMKNSVLVMNVHTNETKIIVKDSTEFHSYDREVWVNPNKHSKLVGSQKKMP